MAQWRLNRENDGVKDEVSGSVFVGLKQAFSDPKVVCLPMRMLQIPLQDCR